MDIDSWIEERNKLNEELNSVDKKMNKSFREHTKNINKLYRHSQYAK